MTLLRRIALLAIAWLPLAGAAQVKVTPKDAAAAAKYSVTWVLVADFNYKQTGTGGVQIWTCDPGVECNGATVTGWLMNLPQPATCKGQKECVLGTFPLGDLSLLKRIYVTSPTFPNTLDPRCTVKAMVTKFAPLITY